MNDLILTPTLFLDQLQTTLLQSNNKCALMLFRLHGMHRMASIFGARLAEKITLELATQVELGLRPKDKVSRLGRFEFAIILSGVMNRGHAVLAANKISAILSAPLYVRKKERKLSFSIGLALSPEHTTDPDQLCQYADLAEIAAKAAKAPYRVFEPADVDDVVAKWDIEGDLERAIASNQLVLHYQPKSSATTGQIVGAEALLRWNHPVHGMISPDRIIPVAERIGAMQKLTWWVLNTALRERRDWGHVNNLSVAINISAVDLTDTSFFKSISHALGIWDTEPNMLTLEITEDALMTDIGFSAAILHKIRAHGIKVSIDDFGTGYSSLAYFKNLPADELKIDRSFVLNILDDELDQHVVSTIIQMAKKMSLKIVAEGIETDRMQQTLINFGCDTIQGFHLARPMPQQAFITWLAKREEPRQGTVKHDPH